MSEAEVMSCAVCARVLNTVVGASGARRWEHALADQPADHPVVPVPVETVRTVGRCDFCSADEPAWIVPARRFPVSGTGTKSMGAWAACDVCVAFIEANRWTALRRHVMTRIAAEANRWAVPDAEAEVALNALWRQLRAHISGPPIRKAPSAP